MPIQPPSFNVPAISPAALLQGRDNEDSFSGMLDQALNFTFNRRLVEQQQEGAMERAQAGQVAQSERSFEQELGRGYIQRVPEGGFDFNLPGDVVPPELETLTGPPGTRFEGQEFVRGSDVERVRQEAELAQPVDQILGRNALPGTTRGDMIDPSGGQMSVQAVMALAQGDKNLATSMIDSMLNSLPEQAEFDGTRQNLLAMRQSVETDESFTLLEEEQIRERVGPQQAIDFAELTRQVNEFNEDERAAVFQAAAAKGQNFQLQVGDAGERANLSPRDRILLGTAEVAPDRLTDAQVERVNALETQLRPRITSPDIQDQLQTDFVRAGVGNSDTNLDFTEFIAGLVRNREGTIINETLRDEIESATGGTTDTHIQSWATQSASSAHRGAFALFHNVGSTRSEIERAQSLGITTPFGINRAKDALEQMIGSEQFNDVFGPRPRDISARDPSRGGIARTPATGPEEEEIVSEGESQFSALREDFRAVRDSLIAEGGADARTELENELVMMQGDRDQVIRTLREAASNIDRVIERGDVADPERLEAQAERLRRGAAMAEGNWTFFQALRDSVMTPALEMDR